MPPFHGTLRSCFTSLWSFSLLLERGTRRQDEHEYIHGIFSFYDFQKKNLRTFCRLFSNFLGVVYPSFFLNQNLTSEKIKILRIEN